MKKDYNADLKKLHDLLDKAQKLSHKIKAMEPVNTYSESEVNKYNKLVNEYNGIADQYRTAVTNFNKKWAGSVEGNGTRSVDPDQLTLPDYLD